MGKQGGERETKGKRNANTKGGKTKKKPRFQNRRGQKKKSLF